MLEKFIDNLNATGPLCPVLFNRLWFAKEVGKPINCGHSAIAGDCNCAPIYVNLTCGHVQGNWPSMANYQAKSNIPVCSICRSEWNVVKLYVGMEVSFWVDCESPSHCFDPCGHVTSEMTVKYNNLIHPISFY